MPDFNQPTEDKYMTKYKVTVCHETYTDYIVEAETEDAAQDLALMGEYEKIDDVVVKESDAIAVEEFLDWMNYPYIAKR